MLYEYEPKVSDFEGSIKIKIPDPDQRLKLVEDCGIEIDTKGKYKQKDVLPMMRKALSYMIKEGLIQEVQLTYKKKIKITKPEDLYYSSEGTEVLSTAVPYILNGISLGGN